ncbi:unnamed protein product [Protopolystoma xenopodis]|uniref:Uncharacterized protein n=1 Tax=Protopolystoma xenopodis TaxID=117903 RepID=A0A3S5AMB6_9PLAT|nr:unnamed protein product [Protopolystoma xenopodis]
MPPWKSERSGLLRMSTQFVIVTSKVAFARQFILSSCSLELSWQGTGTDLRSRAGGRLTRLNGGSLDNGRRLQVNRELEGPLLA